MDAAIALVARPGLRIGRSSEVSQKSTEWRAIQSNGFSGTHGMQSAALRLDRVAMGFPEHLDMAEGIFPVVRAE